MLNTQKEKVSYLIGLDIGANMKSQGIDVDPQALALGLADVFNHATPRINEAEAQKLMEAFQDEMQAKQATQAAAASTENAQAGTEFLAANKNKPGVITTASGLQYKELRAGTGRSPKASDSVKTHYKGTLIDGTEFDSSYRRGEPATFPVGGVIRGWTEALQLMKEGALWELYVPAELAYGARGAGGVIGPNATLVFQVELLQVM